MALKFTPADGVTSVKVGMRPSASGMDLVELDEDLNGVFKVTDKDNQVFVVENTKGRKHYTQTFDLSELVCNES